MSTEPPLTIVIPPEPAPEASPLVVVEEPPLQPERPSSQLAAIVRRAAGKASRQAARGARRLWRTSARRRVTRGLGRGASSVAARSSRLVQEKVVQTAEQQARQQAAAMQTRLKETDWQAETRSGTAKALRWLSRRLNGLAARFSAEKEPPASS